jgi:hypothetical protein
LRESINHSVAEMDASYLRIKGAFGSQAIASFSDKELVEALIVLAANRTGDDSVYVQDGIQAMSINHLILQRTISGIERRSNWTTWIVIVLAVVSVIASIVQIWVSLPAH